MNDILKQRLVGALILLALAVVFWPIIFVETDRSPIPGEMRMPQRPAIDTGRIPEPDASAARRAPAPQARSQAAQQEAVAAVESPDPTPPKNSEAVPAAVPAATNAPRDVRPESPTLDAQGVPIAWILQVASLSDADKAEQLRKRLIAMGHKAYVKTVRRNGKKLLRVYIGPKFERARLDAIKREIDREFKVESLVTRYVP